MTPATQSLPISRERGPFDVDDKATINGQPGVWVVMKTSPNGLRIRLWRPATGARVSAQFREANRRWVIVRGDMSEYLTRVP